MDIGIKNKKRQVEQYCCTNSSVVQLSYLQEPLSEVLMCTCHSNHITGIWNRVRVYGRLLHDIYLCSHICIAKRRHFTEDLFFLSSNCQSVCIMYKIKYILNIFRDILYLAMTFYFSTLQAESIICPYRIVLRVDIIFQCFKSK